MYKYFSSLRFTARMGRGLHRGRRQLLYKVSASTFLFLPLRDREDASATAKPSPPSAHSLPPLAVIGVRRLLEPSRVKKRPMRDTSRRLDWMLPAEFLLSVDCGNEIRQQISFCQSVYQLVCPLSLFSDQSDYHLFIYISAAIHLLLICLFSHLVRWINPFICQHPSPPSSVGEETRGQQKWD